MKEARDLIGRSVSKFREFQARRREAVLERRSIPTDENWFWLMDQIKPAEVDKPVEYKIQNSDYFVKVNSLSGYTQSGSFAEKKYLGVIQPVGIDHHEAQTLFISASLDNQEPQCIVFTTTIFDTSAHPPKVISDKDERTQVVSFGRKGHIVKSPHEWGSKNCFLPLEKERPIDKSRLYLSPVELAEVTDNAYRIASSAITRGIVPEKVQPASPSLLQRPFRLQLI